MKREGAAEVAKEINLGKKKHNKKTWNVVTHVLFKNATNTMGYLSIGGTIHKHQENATVAPMPARKTTLQFLHMADISDMYRVQFIVFYRNSLPVVR